MTRFGKGKEEILFASTVLLVALGDLAIQAGIELIIGNFDASALHLWRRIGCEVEVLGSTSRYGRPVYLGIHPISEAIVGRIKKKLKSARSAFAEARVVAASSLHRATDRSARHLNVAQFQYSAP